MPRNNAVLCRRIVSEIGEQPRYCCKPIKSPSALEWCDAHLARLPLWPVDEQEGFCPSCGETEECALGCAEVVARLTGRR